ncbi:regulator of G-protein signaling 13 [Trichomycterus rosablanca]|uniref:regulator of G-protein signaling 13 n=1 Tax=Trichomycterus rosablanca TaxID=2290929 RepID=UPI002F35F336
MPSLSPDSKELDNMSKKESPPQAQKKDCKWSLQFKLLRTSPTDRLKPEETLLWSQSLENLLKSKSGRATFTAFLKSEHSDENIEFWQTCEDFKKLRCNHRLVSRAKKIFESYIKAESPREINIDHKTREVIRHNVQSPTRWCFDDAQKIVFGLMEKDSYPRFLRSDHYRIFLDSVSDRIMG